MIKMMVCRTNIIKVLFVPSGTISRFIGFAVIFSRTEFKRYGQNFTLEVDHTGFFSPGSQPFGIAVEGEHDGFQDGGFAASDRTENSKKAGGGKLCKINGLLLLIGIK